MRHPIQPLETDSNGVIRFKENKIVSWMLDQGRAGNRFDLNTIAIRDFTREDREQFAQLIGYSHSGASELGYVSTEVLEAAEIQMNTGQTEEQARLEYLTNKLKMVQEGMRAGVAELYNTHPDNLNEDEYV